MAGGRAQTNVSINDPVPASILVQAKSAAHTIYVQKIVYSSVGTVPGTVLNFIDSFTQQSIGTITVLPPASAPYPYVVDFASGDWIYSGTPLTKGAHLQLSILSGGVQGRMYIKAYQLPLFVVVPYVAPQTAGFTK